MTEDKVVDTDRDIVSRKNTTIIIGAKVEQAIDQDQETVIEAITIEDTVDQEVDQIIREARAAANMA